MSTANSTGVRPLIAGNWKMNGLRESGTSLARDLMARLKAEDLRCDVLICPPTTLLGAVAALTSGGPLLLGGQDCHFEVSGAHTGDISPTMLADIGCSHVIVGHSERRHDHGETDALVRSKAEAARANGLTPILCIGETLEERDGGRAMEVVSAQLLESLPEGAEAGSTVVAYEPVWAIGTGRTATAQQIGEVHARIRADLAGIVDSPEAVRILYGGSVKPENAAEILTIADVNGALVGGASLKAADFWEICRSCP